MSNYFRRGDIIIVTNEELQSFGNIGKITDYYDYCDQVYVYFENWNYTGESKTLYFSCKNVEKYDSVKHSNIKKEKDTNMEVKGTYSVALVNFIRGTNTNKNYAFALFDESICEGDLVLVDAESGFSVCKVKEIIPKCEYEGITVTKEIVCKVDFSAYENRKEARKFKESLKKQMDKMVAENQELILYQAIAEKNPVMAQMLEDYKKLGDI